MNWEYLTGFFDGEGCCNIYKDRHVFIQISNTDLRVLKEIQDFLKAGKIRSKQRERKKLCYDLIIHRWQDCLRIAENILPYSIVKHQALKEFITQIKSRKRRIVKPYTYPKFSSEELRELYLNQKLGCQEIAKNVGSNSRQAIWRALKKHGIPTRNNREAQLAHLGKRNA